MYVYGLRGKPLYLALLRQKHLRKGGGELYIEIDRTIDALLGQ